MPGYVAARLRAEAGVPGVVVARLEQTSVRSLVDALIFLADASEPADWNYPIFIP